MKKLLTLYIGILFVNLSFAQEKTNIDLNYLNHPEFLKFKSELDSCRESVKIDSLETIRDDCNKYKLVWAYYIENGHERVEKALGDQLFCNILDDMKELQEQIMKSESIYGSWNYTISVSDCFIIASGDCAVGRELSSTLYYEKID